MLSLDEAGLPPAAAGLSTPVNVPYGKAGAKAQGPAPSPLSSLAAQAVQSSFVSSTTAATQQAAKQALLPGGTECRATPSREAHSWMHE